MNTKLAIGAAILAFSTASFAQEETPADTSPQLSTKSRAEVRAELSMWQRAGLDHYDSEGADVLGADYQRSLNEFSRLMNGPEYLAEVQRIEGNRMRTASTVDETAAAR